jgi:hypothetical protein
LSSWGQEITPWNHSRTKRRAKVVSNFFPPLYFASDVFWCTCLFPRRSTGGFNCLGVTFSTAQKRQAGYQSRWDLVSIHMTSVFWLMFMAQRHSPREKSWSFCSNMAFSSHHCSLEHSSCPILPWVYIIIKSSKRFHIKFDNWKWQSDVFMVAWINLQLTGWYLSKWSLHLHRMAAADSNLNVLPLEVN